MATQRNRKYLLFAGVLIAAGALTIYIQRHQQGRHGLVDNYLLQLTGGAQKQSHYFLKGVTSLVDDYLWLVHAKRENAELKKENLGLHRKLVSAHEIQKENNRLRQALGLSERSKVPLVPAQVIAHDVSSDYFGLRIDKGSLDKVEVGMGVVSPGGIVGRVYRVMENYSDVVTLIDPTSSIDAVIQRSRARGVLSGLSRGLNCKLRYIDRLEDVVVGDKVVASGFGGTFPAGHLIGVVTSVVPNSRGILQSVSVKSAVDIFRLEEVMIVLSRPKQKKVS